MIRLQQSYMRTSEAALALFFYEEVPGDPRVLLRWNVNWQAYSLIGGHREPSESFRECCIREIEEELPLRHEQHFSVPHKHAGKLLEYVAFSKAAGQETEYRFAIFPVLIGSSEALEKIATALETSWVSFPEVRTGMTKDRFEINGQVQQTFEHVGW